MYTFVHGRTEPPLLGKWSSIIQIRPYRLSGTNYKVNLTNGVLLSYRWNLLTENANHDFDSYRKYCDWKCHQWYLHHLYQCQCVEYRLTVVEMPYFILGLFPTVTRGNDNVTITSKRRRLDAIMALLLSHLSAVFFNTAAIELMLHNAWNYILCIQNRSTNMV